MGEVLRISLWSCPRTVSTALLRSWVQRPDTTGVDEPFYAWYLSVTGLDHAMRDEVLAAQATDWRRVVEEVLLGPCPTPVQFVKHMAHHLVGDMDLSFASCTRNVFLIREPRELLPSLRKGLGRVPRLEETGYPRQAELFQGLREEGEEPLVLDSRDLLQEPEGLLRALTGALGLDFDPAMLRWEPGRHPCYGVWAPHWYVNVERSTGFQPWRPKQESFPPELESLREAAEPLYRSLHEARLRPV